MKIKVLYVDDEKFNLVGFKSAFRRTFDVYIAESGAEAMSILEENPDMSVIISDQRMPKMSGTEFFHTIKNKYPFAVRILLTGYTDMNDLVDAVNQGNIYKYLNKPWGEKVLHEVIKKSHEVYELSIKEHEDKKKLEEANSQLEFMLRQKLLS
jgi:response regulator RpfG family c-di-GMP phosphodiesterase